MFEAAGEARVLQSKKDFTPLGFSSTGAVEAGVVFCGYGITVPEKGYDDYAGVDVKGKVVLVFDRAPRSGDPHGPFGLEGLSGHRDLRRKAMNARERGASIGSRPGDVGAESTSILSRSSHAGVFTGSGARLTATGAAARRACQGWPAQPVRGSACRCSEC